MIDNSEPAFPCTELDGNGNLYQTFFGMTLRDYFAAKALQSMLATPQQFTDNTPEIAADWAYKFADAMIDKRRS